MRRLRVMAAAGLVAGVMMAAMPLASAFTPTAEAVGPGSGAVQCYYFPNSGGYPGGTYIVVVHNSRTDTTYQYSTNRPPRNCVFSP